MRTFLLIKKPQDVEIPGDYVILYRGQYYPLSKKSSVYAQNNYPNLPSLGIVLDEKQIELQTKYRRVRVGDTCHIKKIPLNLLAQVFECRNKLEGKIISASDDKCTIQLSTCGLSDIELVAYRGDITLTNVSDLNKVAYIICKECGTKL